MDEKRQKTKEEESACKSTIIFFNVQIFEKIKKCLVSVIRIKKRLIAYYRKHKGTDLLSFKEYFVEDIKSPPS